MTVSPPAGAAGPLRYRRRVTGPPLASGPEADVYALDERRVLRRYRREADVTAEVATMRHVAAEPMLAAFLVAAPGEPARLLDEVVRFRDRQLSGTERLDAAERVLTCAR